MALRVLKLGGVIVFLVDGVILDEVIVRFYQLKKSGLKFWWPFVMKHECNGVPVHEYGVKAKQKIFLGYFKEGGKKKLKPDALIGLIPEYKNGKGIKEEQQEKPKREFITYKYSRMGRGPLHESVIVNGLPFFVKYDHITNTFELVENIPENSRVLRPPNIEEYPYIPYEFESNEELQSFIDKAKNTTLDDLYKQ